MSSDQAARELSAKGIVGDPVWRRALDLLKDLRLCSNSRSSDFTLTNSGGLQVQRLIGE